MTKLTDTQLIVLTAAAGRDDGSILPLPKSVKGGAADKVVESLIKKGLVERIIDGRPAIDDVFKITAAGLAAINADPDDGAQAATGAPKAKKAANAAGKGKKATSRARKGDTGATSAEAPVPAPYREGTKQALLIAMLRRPEGATVDEVVRKTGWQRHSVRGAISGAIKKKLGLTVESERDDNRGRVYRIVQSA